MDFTIRHMTSDGKDELIPANGRVAAYRKGSPMFQEFMAEKPKDCPDFCVEGCRAVVCYHCYDHEGMLYLYEDDKAFVMNSSGNTVNAV